MNVPGLSLNSIFVVYALVPRDSGTTAYRLMGKYMLLDDTLIILSDYYGTLSGSLKEGPLDAEGRKKLRALQHASYFEVVSMGALNDGFHPELLEQMSLGAQPEPDASSTMKDMSEEGQGEGANISAPPTQGMPAQQVAPNGGTMAIPEQPTQPVFDYLRVGMSQPVPLEVVDGEMLLNGHPLEQDEIDQIMHNLRSGAASLRYRQSPFRAVAVQKMEAHLEQMDPLGVVPGEDEVLAKGIADKIKGVFQKVIQRNQPQETSDLAPEEAALEHFKKLAKDPASQAHYDALRRAMFEDSMIPGMGNKRAFTNFQAREQKKNSGGIHIMMDGNDFKRINDDISHEAGDQAIGLMGRAVQDAIHESVGHENAKSHRFGGDEFHVHVPTMEHATQFTRKLREKLEAIPAVNGTHKLSMSVGLGNSYEDADAALNHPTEPSAKTVKGTDKTKVVGEDGSGLSKWLGADKMYVHSRVKGFEGPVPMHEPNPMASMKAAGLKMPSAAKLPSPAPAKAPGVAPMQTTTVGSTPDPTPAPRSPGVAPIKA